MKQAIWELANWNTGPVHRGQHCSATAQGIQAGDAGVAQALSFHGNLKILSYA